MTELEHDDANSMNPDGGMSPVPTASPPAQSQTANGMAIASLIVGLFSVGSVCLCGLFGALPLGITGIIMAVLSRKRPGQRELGTAGLILSICAIAFSVIYVILALTIEFELPDLLNAGNDGKPMPTDREPR